MCAAQHTALGMGVPLNTPVPAWLGTDWLPLLAATAHTCGYGANPRRCCAGPRRQGFLRTIAAICPRSCAEKYMPRRTPKRW
jgi:hypothetical protein